MTKKEKELLKLAQEFCEKFIALQISSATEKSPEQNRKKSKKELMEIAVNKYNLRKKLRLK